MKHVNIGNLGRWALRQTFGTATGQGIIDALENGLGAAIYALGRGDIAGFYNAIPVDLRDKFLTEAAKHFGK